MSDPDSASVLRTYEPENKLAVAMGALALFEYLTTLDQEFSAVWKRKLSGASLLLIAIRYTMLISAILNIYPIQALTASKKCTAPLIIEAILALFGNILTASFSSLRVYALCGGEPLLSVVVLVLLLTPVAINMYGYIETTVNTDATLGCLYGYKIEAKVLGALIFVSRSPDMAGDLLVVIITWIKSFRQLREQHNLGIQLPLSTLMFRDGTAYFLVLLGLDVLEIAPIVKQGGYVITYLPSSLPLILAHRFMLNLRQLGTSEAPARGLRTVSMPLFSASIDIAGNMGEILEHGWEAIDDKPETEESPRRNDDTRLGTPRRVEEAGPSGYVAE